MEGYEGKYLVKDMNGTIVGEGYNLYSAWSRAKENYPYGQVSVEYISIDGDTLGYEQLKLFEDTSFIEE